MAKFTPVLYVTLILGFGLLATADSDEKEGHSSSAEKEDKERIGFPRGNQRFLARAQPNANDRGSGGPGGPAGSRGAVSGNHQCYTCVDCPDHQLAAVRYCADSPDASRSNACVTYTEQVKNQKPAVVRGCVSERGNCAEIKNVLSRLGVALLSCNECKGDKCNGASRTLTDMTMAFMALLVTPLVAKMTLS